LNIPTYSHFKRPPFSRRFFEQQLHGGMYDGSLMYPRTGAEILGRPILVGFELVGHPQDRKVGQNIYSNSSWNNFSIFLVGL
jgi:hypothetical protein